MVFLHWLYVWNIPKGLPFQPRQRRNTRPGLLEISTTAPLQGFWSTQAISQSNTSIHKASREGVNSYSCQEAIIAIPKRNQVFQLIFVGRYGSFSDESRICCNLLSWLENWDWNQSLGSYSWTKHVQESWCFCQILSVMGRESVGWHVQGMMAIGHRFPILHRGAKASDQLGLSNSWVGALIGQKSWRIVQLFPSHLLKSSN